MSSPDIAAAATKARNREALGDVLLVVPLIELLASFRRDVVPHDHAPTAQEGARCTADRGRLAIALEANIHASHRPLKAGSRFAKSAATPSCRSSLSKMRC